MKWYQLISIVKVGDKVTSSIEFVYTNHDQELLKRLFEEDLRHDFPDASFGHVEVVDLPAALSSHGLVLQPAE